MNVDDFHFVWRGKSRHPISTAQKELLEPIDQRREGNQHALLLLHGFSSSPAVFRKLVPSLNSYNAIICPKLPGHGESIDVFSKVKATDWFVAAEQTLDSLTQKYQQVDILGLSLGALIACHLSQRFTPRRLYLLAPALTLNLNINLALKLIRLLNFLGFKHLRNRAGNLYSDLYGELTYRKLPISAIFEILTLIKNYQFIPPKCPIELFLGSFDKVINTEVIEKQFSTLPNVQIHWLKHSAHVLPLDGDVNFIAKCILKHLK